MGEFKHMVLVKFKEGVIMEDLLEQMKKMVSELDLVKTFEWGQGIESEETLRQGFTHSFTMTFASEGDFTTFLTHPIHLDFAKTFSASIENAVLFDYPVVQIKPLS